MASPDWINNFNKNDAEIKLFSGYIQKKMVDIFDDDYCGDCKCSPCECKEREDSDD